MDILEFLKDVPQDQLIAVSCQAFSIFAAALFYRYLKTENSSINSRHFVSSLIGVSILFLCYGWESLHLFALCFTGYFLLQLRAQLRGWLTFALCIAHVLSVHLHGYLYYHMQFRVDISGPLMVLAIKVSYVAFSLDDNFKERAALTTKQLRHRLTEMPSLFEYFSYCFCFLGVLFGPTYHFSDYISFIKGDQYKVNQPTGRAVKMLCLSIVCLVIHFLLSDHYGATFNLTPHAMTSSFLTRHFYIWFTMLIARCKYYFCWLSSEAICYFGGLGYYLAEGENLETKSPIATVKLLKIEFATSLKTFTDSWNIFTAQWLHFCVYERVKHYKVFCVFILSATWHGFYPGYYLMFMPLGMSVMLGRKIRKTVRPIFQHSSTSQLVYDIITWLATTTLIAFNSSAFELKTFAEIYKLQSSLYFWPHVVVLLGLIFIHPSRSQTKLSQNGSKISNGHHPNNHSLHSG